MQFGHDGHEYTCASEVMKTLCSLDRSRKMIYSVEKIIPAALKEFI